MTYSCMLIAGNVDRLCPPLIHVLESPEKIKTDFLCCMKPHSLEPRDWIILKKEKETFQSRCHPVRQWTPIREPAIEQGHNTSCQLNKRGTKKTES